MLPARLPPFTPRLFNPIHRYTFSLTTHSPFNNGCFFSSNLTASRGYKKITPSIFFRKPIQDMLRAGAASSQFKRLRTPEAMFGFKKSIGNRDRLKKVALMIGATIAGYLIYDPSAVKFFFGSITRGLVAGVTGVTCIIDYKINWPAEDILLSEEELAQLKSTVHLRNAVRLLDGMKLNGGIYIKLGQHLSALGYVLPLEWTETFRVLHDRCPSTSKEEINDMLIKDFGKGIDEIFSEFDDEPIGVASIAQVHRARLKDSNQEVAVKLQHPKISKYSSFDLKTTTAIVKLAKWLLPNFEFSWLAEEMNRNLPIELNFKFEDENASRARENFAHSKKLALKIPMVYWANRRMICMEFVTGAKLDDHVYMKNHGIDPNQVSREITKIFSEMIYLHGWVHCDAHPGNIMIRASNSKKGFEVILLDHGLYRHLSEDFRFLYAKLWLSIIEKNTEKIREVSFLLGGTDATYKLITGILTGNSWSSIQPSSANLMNKKNDIHAHFISLIPDIAHLMAQVPRELIFLFKTQDLLKLVHQDLDATQDQKVQYLIMARYCSEVIYQSHFSKTFKSPANGILLFEKSIFSYLGVWLNYWGFRLQLKVYLLILSFWPNFSL